MRARRKPAAEPDRPSTGVRQQQKQQTREALLEAARKVIKRRGFARTTTREVAREAGVSVGTVFLHFPEVSALAETLLDEHIGAALEAAFRTMPARGDLVDRLIHVARKLFDSYAVDPELSREYLSGSLFRSDAQGPAAKRIAGLERWVIAQVEDVVARRAMPAIDPRLAFAGFFSLYFGALIGGLRGQLSRKAQLAVLEAALRQFFHMEADR